MTDTKDMPPKTSSWADAAESDDEDSQPARKPLTNAWSKPNPWTAATQSESPAPAVPFGDESAFPAPAATTVKSKAKDSGRRHSEKSSSSSEHRNDAIRRDDFRDRRGDDRRDGWESRRDDYRDRRDRDDSSRDNYRDRRDDYDKRGRRDDYGRRDYDRSGRDRYEGRGGRYNRRRDDFERDGRRDWEDRKPRTPAELPAEPPFTAFIGNLSYDTNEDAIAEFLEHKFEDIKITTIRLQTDKNTRSFKGYGYVEFETVDDLKQALTLNGELLQDRAIRIDIAAARQDDKRDKDWGSLRRREESSDSGRKERPQLKLAPRTVDTPSDKPVTPAAATEVYQQSKSNPFGDAKPRDENYYLNKKLEERKRREGEGKEKPENVNADADADAEQTEKSPTADTTGKSEERDPAKSNDNKEHSKYDASRSRDSWKGRRENGGFERRDDRGRGRGGRRGYDTREGNQREFRGRGRRDYGDSPRPRAKEEPPKKEVSVKSVNMFAALGEEDE